MRACHFLLKMNSRRLAISSSQNVYMMPSSLEEMPSKSVAASTNRRVMMMVKGSKIKRRRLRMGLSSFSIIFCGLVMDNLGKFRDFFSFLQVFSIFSCKVGGFWWEFGVGLGGVGIFYYLCRKFLQRGRYGTGRRFC